MNNNRRVLFKVMKQMICYVFVRFDSQKSKLSIYLDLFGSISLGIFPAWRREALYWPVKFTPSYASICEMDHEKSRIINAERPKFIKFTNLAVALGHYS